jgi:hypothetical protein
VFARLEEVYQLAFEQFKKDKQCPYMHRIYYIPSPSPQRNAKDARRHSWFRVLAVSFIVDEVELDSLQHRV